MPVSSLPAYARDTGSAAQPAQEDGAPDAVQPSALQEGPLEEFAEQEPAAGAASGGVPGKDEDDVSVDAFEEGAAMEGGALPSLDTHTSAGSSHLTSPLESPGAVRLLSHLPA